MFHFVEYEKKEELRKSIPESENIELKVTELASKSKNIHAGFLFENVGKIALANLCSSLSKTNNDVVFEGWYCFGMMLGIDGDNLRCIKNNLHWQDPTYYTLNAFVQKEDSSISKILETLFKMKRYDTITKSYSSLEELIENILKVCQNKNIEPETMIRPKIIYPSVLIFTQFDNLTIEEIQPSSIQYSGVTVNDHKAMSEQTYRKIVLLTFTFDGEEYANQLARTLRDHKPERIGVVMLKEHAKKLDFRMDSFVYECCCQVNYIIPIITNDYIRRITTAQPNINSILEGADDYFVRPIYKFYNFLYLRYGCINVKVRAIIPDDLLNSICSNPVMHNPIFQVWAKLSQTNLFTNYLGINQTPS